MHSPKARGPLQTPTEGWRKGSCVMEKLYFPLGFLQKELRSATQQELASALPASKLAGIFLSLFTISLLYLITPGKLFHWWDSPIKSSLTLSRNKSHDFKQKNSTAPNLKIRFTPQSTRFLQRNVLTRTAFTFHFSSYYWFSEMSLCRLWQHSSASFSWHIPMLPTCTLLQPHNFEGGFYFTKHVCH